MDYTEKARIFRSRFYGRQEVYGRMWATKREDGSEVRGYAPVCENIWKDGCHLKLKDGVTCDSCDIKEYSPVSDESVIRHIKGEEAQIHYVVQPDGTHMFGAIDFDYKEGKEHKGYTWKDVVKVKEVLDEWGIDHGIARSTGNGFHVYFFFEDFFPANKFRAIIIAIYERVGFCEEMRQGLRFLPEVFPKQSYTGKDGIGNGIKPPMVESRFSKERNGFVTKDNTFIPPEVQWEYLENIPRIPTKLLEALIEEHGIAIYEDSPTGSGRSRTSSCGAPLSRGSNGAWQPPLVGSIEKVLEGCAAFRAVRDKALAGKQLSHHEGFSLYHVCMSTSDGKKWFEENVTTWGKSAQDIKQLDHSRKKNYAPWTCTKMQTEGVCVPGTRCFEKKPPIDMVEGQVIVMKDIPKEQWPEPSPIRYAFGTGEDFLEKLLEEIKEVRKSKDREEKLKVLQDVARRAQVFDGKQQDDLKKKIKRMRVADLKTVDVNKMFNAAVKEKEEEVKDIVEERDDSVNVHDNAYKKVIPYGYYALKRVRGATKKIQLCSSDITIKEVSVYIDDDEIVKSDYVGKVASVGVEKKFSLDAKSWCDNSKFYEFFSVLLDSKFNALRQNVDYIRQAAMGFSEKEGIAKSSYMVTQGWFKNTYLMPSLLIDKDSVRPNTEQKVDLSFKEHAKKLDFKLLKESEFSEVMMHIKSDLLNAWPRRWTFMALSHTLLAGILKPLGIRKKPTMFFEGLTGVGKTELTHLCQYFWGNFDGILNLQSTGKGVMDVGHDFKDALLVVDDYKGLDYAQIKNLKHVIQYSYDQTTSIKLRRDSTQMKSKGSRALFMMSGEEFISAQASMVARCILIEVNKHDTRTTREKYESCWRMCGMYQGVTPRYLQWFLQQDIEEVKVRLLKYKNKIYENCIGRQNADRVAYNLALNHLSWDLFTEFMVMCGISDHKEKNELMVEHWLHIDECRATMLNRCEEEQNGIVFVRVLKQLIDAGEVSVINLSGHEHDHKPVIGFVSRGSDDPSEINVYPDIAFNTVKKAAKEPAIGGTERSIARQLVDMKVIKTTDKGRLKKLVRNRDGRQWVWVMDLEQLGFDTPRLRVAGQPEPLPMLDSPMPEIDSEGIY